MVKAVKSMRRRSIDPSPDEIRARAEIIRRSWSERERVKRAIWTPPPWLPPTMDALPESPVWCDD
jgi:hypothetical protein